MSNIKVSICCLAYNHEPYIKQCLEGFILQKCNFSFEVLIHEDASTDRTASILKEYEAKYPDIIKPIYQTQNQYSKGIKPTFEYNFPRAQGKYIALCEGDDYWTDPLKLQKQVDFLEENEEYSMCFHNTYFVDSAGSLVDRDLFSHLHQGVFSGVDILKKWTVPTVTVVFKNLNIQNYLPPQGIIYGDIYLFLLMAENGLVYCINDKMAVYRTNPESLTNVKKSINDKLDFIKHHKTIQKLFNSKYKNVTNDTIALYHIMVCFDYLRKFSIIYAVNHFMYAIFYNSSVTFKFLKNKIKA